VGQIQVAADVGKRFRQGLGPSGPHVVQALADALQNAGFLGFFLLAEQAEGGRDRLVGGRESAASHLGLHELLEVCGQMGMGQTGFFLPNAPKTIIPGSGSQNQPALWWSFTMCLTDGI